MAFFCLVETTSSATPHLHPMEAETLAEARAEALRLMREHTQPAAARIYLDSDEVEVVEARSAL